MEATCLNTIFIRGCVCNTYGFHNRNFIEHKLRIVAGWTKNGAKLIGEQLCFYYLIKKHRLQPQDFGLK